MLRDNYKIKFNKVELLMLNDAIDHMFNHHGLTKDLELMLPLVCLRSFKMRLAGMLVFVKEKNLISVKSTEAIAFLLLYKSGIIPANIATQQIATLIDRTI